MTQAEQERAAEEFAAEWKDRGHERRHAQPFWMELLRRVYGVSNPAQFISFEEPTEINESTKFVDGYIEDTHVLIEQKGSHVNLDTTEKQSDKVYLTPYHQAKRYADNLPYYRKPRYIVCSNFREFHVYDMNETLPEKKRYVIRLDDLPKEFSRLQFLVDEKNAHLQKELDLSVAAGKIVGEIYDALLPQYKSADREKTLRSINKLCVRLVFCLYAEDSGLFNSKNQFHDYLNNYPAEDTREALISLFSVLARKENERDPYLKPQLAAFPYVNGGLFDGDEIEIPNFTDEIRELLLRKASEEFNWSEISPTIFGAVFESTLNPDTRRKGGMHYTSVENIHKVIDPLFLDELKAELDGVLAIKSENARKAKVGEFQKKLGSLHFFDPACGSGNFLTETYLSLRRLENKALAAVAGGQIQFGADLSPIQVNISQFHGIEINDFAVTVARTALWIAESQMMKATEKIVATHIPFLPLKSNASIVEGNALRMDWEEATGGADIKYIMGNPPFVGHQWRNAEQKADMDFVFDGFGNYGKLDYVACWYKKSYEFIKGTEIKCAFVSTNSITQGESVATMWKPLFEMELQIDFAYQTFKWNSESTDQAAVHCVIIGFSCGAGKQKIIFDEDGNGHEAKNINGYLLDAPNVFIENRGAVLTKGLPKMSKGSQPTDGGNLLLSEEEMNGLISKEPLSKKWIKKFMMGQEFINNIPRYCLWLVNANPAEIKKCPSVMARIQRVHDLRIKSPTKSVQHDADIPMLFTQIRQPVSRYLVIPRVSSENRKYIPMGFLESDVIAGDKLQFIPNASLYLFGILISNVHMAWMRVVAGRLKSDYSYSPAVYNNFPWCEPTDEQKEKIEQTAQDILDARAKYPDSSLGEMYSNLLLYPELNKAHQANDKAVLAAYGFSEKISEAEIVSKLMGMYQNMVK